jgi:hypothetical protein
MLHNRVNWYFAEGRVENWVMHNQVRHVLLEKLEAFAETVNLTIQALLS